jgi:hypothetical protein
MSYCTGAAVVLALRCKAMVMQDGCQCVERLLTDVRMLSEAGPSLDMVIRAPCMHVRVGVCHICTRSIQTIMRVMFVRGALTTRLSL